MNTSLISPQLVSDKQLSDYAKLIYDRTGIRISPQKKSLLSNRLKARLRATGIQGYDEYLRHLKSLKPGDAEWDAFLQEITTHETYLFRDQMQWEWLQSELIPELEQTARKGARPKSIKVWSAASSTGDEACTIACCILDRLTNAQSWKVEVVGTDIGIKAVEAARRATFTIRAMRNVPESFRRRFFKQDTPESWQAKKQVTDLMKFHHHNLMDTPPVTGFDVVFLKNVLIYFDKKSKETVLEHIISSIKPGGYLVTGPSEGVTGMLDKLARRQGWLHQKV